MKNKAICFAIVLLLAFTMASCGEDEMVTRYVFPGLRPEPQRSLQEIIDFNGGAHFQNHFNISLRFFSDGYFQRWGIGLFAPMQGAGTSGNRFRIAGDTIFFYFDPADGPPATAHRHALRYRMEGTNLIFVEAIDGAATAPTDVLTRPAYPGSAATLPHIFSIGPIPDFQGW